jgi:TRAP-type C4-dicarboxylate transport system substrate-binding protein
MRQLLKYALMGFLACRAFEASAQPVTLKLSFFANDAEVNYAKVIKPWLDAVNADPSGAVKIDAYPNGALGKAFPAQAQMILDGVADIAFVNPSLSAGRFPDDQVLELPGLVHDLTEGTRLYEALVKANALRGYNDFHVIGSFSTPIYHIWSRKQIRSIADLKGMKVRIAGPSIGQTVKELGMVPIMMPPNEVVEAIGRGTVDAATLVPPAVVDFGIERVTTYDYLLPLGSGPLAVMMNKAKFEALPPAAKAVISKYSLTYINDLYIKNVTAFSDSIVAKFKTEPKRTVVTPSATDLAALKVPYEKVTADWAAKDPVNAKVLAKARELLAEIRAKK